MGIVGEIKEPNGVLKYALWNIQGYKSKISGKKFISPDFLQEIRGADIVGLTETPIHTQRLMYKHRDSCTHTHEFKMNLLFRGIFVYIIKTENHIQMENVALEV